MVGEVVKLDRKFPLVRLDDGCEVRCEHATDVKKTGETRAVVGDLVEIEWPEGHDKAIIVAIEPRTTALVRRDPAEQTREQVLAANFDMVIVAEPLAAINIRRLERELVLAFETGARVAVVLTKADLAESEEALASIRERVAATVGEEVPVLVMSDRDEASIERVRELVGPGTTAVLIGKSGVGKSSLVNLLVGEEVQATGKVRERDGKGRHTTVAREIVEIPGGGRLVDMPGVRGLALWEADEGIQAAFSDVEELAAECRFRDCRHENEPGCAVRAAVEAGVLARERLDSYLALRADLRHARTRREQKHWKNK